MIDTKKYCIRVTYGNKDDKLFERFYLTNVTDYKNTKAHHDFEYVKSMSAEQSAFKMTKKDVHRYIKYLLDHPNKLPICSSIPQYMSIEIHEVDKYRNSISMMTTSEDILSKVRRA